MNTTISSKVEIPEMWTHQVNKKGKLFLSENTLADVKGLHFDVWLCANYFYIQYLPSGAFVRPKVD